MSIVDTYKEHFRIFSYDEDLSRGALMSEMFRSQGYDYATFNDRDIFHETMGSQIPHIFILYYQPLNMKFRETLQKIREASSEVEVILLGSNDFWPGVSHLIEKGQANDFWSWPLASPEVLKLRVDKIIEKTIYKYISEQKSEETHKIVQSLETLRESSYQVSGADQDANDLFSMDSDAQSEGALIEQWIDGLKTSFPAADFVYLKNYKAKDQLLVSRTSFSKETYYRGQTLSMSSDVLAEDKENNFVKTRSLLEETFSASEFTLEPIAFAGEIYGFLMAINCETQNHRYLKRAAKYVGLSLRSMMIPGHDKSSPDFDVESLQVEARSFFSVLTKEVSRARRIEKPLSLILGHIQFAGDEEKERKALQEFFDQNLRAYDMYAQISGDEIAIVLPHCDYKNAAIKTERLRRMILNRGMKTQNTPLRLCFGVTEYPSLSADSDQLLMDARAACDQVLASGNNKVCLFAAPKDFEPEFTI